MDSNALWMSGENMYGPRLSEWGLKGVQGEQYIHFPIVGLIKEYLILHSTQEKHFVKVQTAETVTEETLPPAGVAVVSHLF